MSEGRLDLRYEDPQRRAVFDAGAIAGLAAELEREGWRRVLVITTAGRAGMFDRTIEALGDRVVARFAGAAPHVPAAQARDARQQAAAHRVDALVALGGGSPIGLAKAVALEGHQPIAAVPTTYSGSEMTPIWGVTEDGVKRTGRDPRVAPRVVLYDPDLTAALPADVAAASGLNAMAHAIEALYAPGVDGATMSLAAAAIGILAASLPARVRQSDDSTSRRKALLGAHYAGVALARATMGLHHRLCHVLGGAFDLPHALTHAILLPHVVRFNEKGAPDALRIAAEALGAPTAADGLAALAGRLRLPASLRAVGFDPAQIDRVAALVLSGPFPNPRAVEASDVRAILGAASRA